MKKTVLKLFIIMLLACISFSASAVKLDGSMYQGITKVPGSPVDMWTTVEFTATDMNLNLANMVKFSGNITSKEVDGKLTVTGTLQPGDGKITLNSSDGGSSFEGKYSLNGTLVTTWLLNVPCELTPATQSTQELAEIVGSSDGYTSFLLIEMQGNTCCATADFSFNNADGTWKMICDSETIQKLLGNMQGTYSIDGSNIYFTDSAGVKASGTIYEDGNYIKSPLGSAQGMIITLLLIR